MIAIPVKTNKENTAVSTLFGKAKYFALINNNKINIVKNELLRGKAIIEWLKNQNVDTLITSHMGEKPFNLLLDLNIKTYFAGDKRIELKDILLKYADGELPILNKQNFKILIKEDDSHSSCCSNKKINSMNENKLQKPPYKSFIRNIHY
jgi:predicted Fe-Mo cluster-binding NifX family protein